MQIPNDPVMRLSVINTALRDHYPTLDELVKSENIDKNELTESLKKIGYYYDSSKNKFI